MPTPVGHSLAGMTICLLANKSRPGLLKRWPQLLFCMFISNLPDIDFVNLSTHGLKLSWENHHGPTHSIAFALLVAGVVGGITRLKRNSFLRWFFITFWCVGIHILLDYFGAKGCKQGLMLFYPFSVQYFAAPIRMFSGILPEDIFSIYSAMSMLWEAGLIGLVLVGVAIVRKRGISRKTFL